MRLSLRRARLSFLSPLLASALAFGCESSDDATTAVADVGADGASDSSDGSDATDGASGDDADASDGAPEVPLSFCQGPTRFRYDPEDDSFLGAFPDDFWTLDADTASGVEIAIDEKAKWIGDVPGTFGKNVLELNGLDGFGTIATVFLRFSDALPESLNSPGEAPDGVRFVAIEDGEVKDVDFQTSLTDDGTTLLVEPLRPLAPNTLHAVWVTREVLVGDDCIAPGATLEALLSGEAGQGPLARLQARYDTVLDATGLRGDELSAATVFTTQDPTRDDTIVGADIRSRTYAWSDVTCDTKVKGVKHCEATFDGRAYTADKVYAGGAPQATWTYPVSLWFPDSDGPHPTVLFAHGIGGDRSQAKGFAEYFAAEFDVAIVSIDAVEHGEHPGGSGGGGQMDVLGFFAVDLGTASVNGRILRDNWRQSAWDKLQLVELFEDAPDVDGDGKVDIDLERIGFLGVSLGGIMGPQLLSLTDRFGAAILDICGGRLTSILDDSDTLGVFTAIGAPGASEGDIKRFFAVAQVIIEAGDPVSYSPYVVESRKPDAGSRAPHVLLQIAIGDEVIPNSASWWLARSLGVPHIAPVHTSVPLVELQPGDGPVSGNLLGGTTTGGLFQLDRVSYGDGKKPEAAGHQTTPGSSESITQAVTFLQSWIETGLARIIDPYDVVGTPPLGQ
jgi:hypothetical protein